MSFRLANGDKVKDELPAGYLLQVETWENDYDSLTTQVLAGLTAEDLGFYIALAQAFGSRHGRTNKGYGNGAVTKDELDALVGALLAKYPDVTPALRIAWTAPEFDEDEDCLSNDAYGMICKTVLNYPVAECYRFDYTNFCRVYNKHVVFQLDTPAKLVT